MKYRWKLVILLLVIGLLPIWVMRNGVRYNLRTVGNLIVEETGEKVIKAAQDRLRLLVEGFAAVIWADRVRLETALSFQVREVEQCLAGTVAETGRVYFAEDFMEPGRRPADFSPSPWQVRAGRDGVGTLLEVSYTEQVFKTAPGLSREAAADDVARLSGLNKAYRDIYKNISDNVLWQETVLKNGLLSSYPGHGRIPKAMDPRRQPSYREDSKTVNPIWSRPYIDPVTRQVVYAASLPVRGPNGDFAGVTSLVFPVHKILDRRGLMQNIPPETRVFLSVLLPEDENGSRRVVNIVSEEYRNLKTKSWRSDLASEILKSDDQAGLEGLKDDFASGRANSRRMPYQGRDSLWVYGPAMYESPSSQAFLVVISPYDSILKPAMVLEESIQGMIDNTVSYTRYGMAAMVFLIVFLALIFSMTVTRPLQALVVGARRLADGDFEASTNIRTSDEFGDLGRVFNRVGPRLKEHYRMSQALGLAVEVQQNLLPHRDPMVPGLEASGASMYCDETGGDYFDYFQGDAIGEGDLAVAVGDVSGHGIQAALLMASARASLRQRMVGPGSLAEIVGDVNDQLSRDVRETGQFMTLFVCRIILADGVVQWVRGGHDPAIIYDPDTDSFSELGGQGLALGVAKGYDYNEYQQDLPAGRIIVIGTDGIWEAHDEQGRVFGKQAFRELIRKHSRDSSRNIVRAVLAAVEEFRGSVERQDDVTLVVIKNG